MRAACSTAAPRASSPRTSIRRTPRPVSFASAASLRSAAARSSGGLPQLDFAAHPVGEATEAINASTLVIVMIETPEAVENVDAIAAVEGVDGLLVGTNDLCMEMGMPGRVGDPAVMEAQAKVIAACRRHRRFPGLGGVYEPSRMERYIEMGMRLILCGNDLSMLMAGASARSKQLRGLALD